MSHPILFSERIAASSNTSSRRFENSYAESGLWPASINAVAILSIFCRVPEDEWTIIDDYYEDYASEDEMEDYSTKPVPIWLSICLVIGYIVGGAFLFQVRNTKHSYVNCDQINEILFTESILYICEGKRYILSTKVHFRFRP